jgi:hypothetical protein
MEVERLKLQGPFVIKLDTHGYEVPILEGAWRTLRQTHLIIMECYGFRIAQHSLLLWEMCKYLDDKGFGLVDLVDVTRRPTDGAFWQCDSFFAPKSAACFTSNNFR